MPILPTSILLLDLDDTLIETAPVFIATYQAFTDMVCRVCPDASPSDVKRDLMEMEVRRTVELGVRAERLIGSMSEVCDYYCNRFAVDPDVRNQAMSEVASIAALPERAEYPPTGGALAALRRYVRSGMALGLLTKGLDALQWSKIEAAGMSDLFDEVLIDTTKTPSHMLELIARLDPQGRVPFDQITMVGDSMRDDIHCANTIGINSVLVHCANPSWHFNHLEDAQAPSAVISRFSALPTVVPCAPWIAIKQPRSAQPAPRRRRGTTRA